jgi:hypothetical protein
MMEVSFLLCAESAVVDSTSNKLTIINVVEELSAAGFPAVIPTLTIVALISRKKTEAEKPPMRVVATQNNKELFAIPINSSFQGKFRSRILVGIQGIVIPGVGRIMVSLNHKNKSLGSWPIEVLDIRSSPAITVPPLPISSATSTPKQTAIQKRRRRKP